MTTPHGHAGNYVAGEWLQGDACEVQRGIENVEHAAGMPTLMMGDTLDDVARGVDCPAVRQPIGVFAVITPYNFPVMIPLWFWPYAVAAGNTVVVGVGDVYEPVREGILDGAAALRMGRGLDEGVDMGPVISAAHRDRVTAFIDEGERDGARLVMDGRRAEVRGYPRGHWVGPTVFEDVTPEMPIGREEVFGPVAGLARAPSLEAALELLAKSPYGNAASIFTQSGRAAREFRYRAGISMIGVNIGVAAPMAFFPFGGTRNSFHGDLKAQGRDAVSFYTDQRVVISRW